MPWPVEIATLGTGVKIHPPAVMNCETALAATRYVETVVQPAARTRLGTQLVSVAQASAYVCRPRNGTRKLSEHAFGNALDIAGFAFADGTEIPVADGLAKPQDDFLAEIRSKACGPFKTVLGPGSDADHASHLHLDLAKRRNGATVCE